MSRVYIFFADSLCDGGGILSKCMATLNAMMQHVQANLEPVSVATLLWTPEELRQQATLLQLCHKKPLWEGRGYTGGSGSVSEKRPPFFHRFATDSSLIFCRLCTDVSPIFHRFSTDFPPIFHRIFTDFSPIHRFFTGFCTDPSPILHQTSPPILH